MNDKTDKAKEKEIKEDLIDPNATAPSNDPNRKSKDKATSTATEPNSKQRVAKKASRTGRNNGGGEVRRGGLNMELTPDTLGEREGVSPADTDLIWTNDSKDRWGVDQPGLDKMLAQRDAIAEQQRKRDEE